MSTYYVAGIPYSDELYHHGIKGQKWGRRRFQNDDGSLTNAGRDRYGVGEERGSSQKNIGQNKQPRDYSKLKKAAKIAAITAAAAAAGYGAYKLGKNIQFGHEQIVDQIANKKIDVADSYRDAMVNLNNKSYVEQLRSAVKSGDQKGIALASLNQRTNIDHIIDSHTIALNRIESERAALKKGASFVTKITNATKYARQVKNIRR